MIKVIIMRIRKHDYLVIALAAPLFLAACADKDVYDPNKVRPIAPVENPLGEDFVAPEGFDWSMITTVKLNVEVKDLFNGQYNYLVEVFTSNPLSNETATPLSAGYAKHGSNYIAEISVPKATTHLFIRQTDPKQRKEIFEYAVPKDGETINSKLYFTEVQTKALPSHGTSGWDQITPMNIEATPIDGIKDDHIFHYEAGGQLKNNTTFIIEGEYTKGLTSENWNNGTATVIIKGTWKMQGTLQGLRIIVASQGKITGDNILLGNGSSIEIQKGGIAEFKTFSLQTDDVIHNFGTFKADKISDVNSGCLIYNGKEATFDVTNNIESFKSSTLHNHGNFIVGGNIRTNDNDLKGIIANYEAGYLKATEFIGGVKTFINDNIVEVEKYDANNITASWLYNNCTFIAKKAFYFTQLVVDNGSITGAQNGDVWAATEVKSYNDGNIAKLTLKNGSIIKSTTFTCGSSLEINAGTNTPSMVQAETITYEWTTYLKGNLILAVNNEINAGVQVSWGISDRRYEKESSVKITKKDEAKEEIETCTGIIYEGNSGNPDPEDPSKPDIGDNIVYTYAFEDQWPAYGDFDMNDVIVSINKMAITDNKKLTIQGNIRAVGSSRKTGIGIQFLNVSSNGVILNGKVQSGTPIFESGQNNPVIILSTNAHKYCNPSIVDDDFTFYCTDPTAGSTYNSGNGAEFEITLTFSTAEAAVKAMNINNIDIFIISKEAQGDTRRTEIHLPNHAPTNLGTTALFGMSNDASAYNNALDAKQKGYYISTEGLAWGICIPSTEVWKWPKERKKITDVYPEFKAWVISGGETENQDWISNHNNDIFIRP